RKIPERQKRGFFSSLESAYTKGALSTFPPPRLRLLHLVKIQPRKELSSATAQTLPSGSSFDWKRLTLLRRDRLGSGMPLKTADGQCGDFDGAARPRSGENLFLSLPAVQIALQKSRSFLFVLLSTNPQNYFADLGHASSLFVCNLQQILLEFCRNSES